MSLAGKNSSDDSIKIGYFSWIPFDLLTVVYALLATMAFFLIWDMIEYDFSLIALYPSAFLIVLILFLYRVSSILNIPSFEESAQLDECESSTKELN